jgi:hypothetical protein
MFRAADDNPQGAASRQSRKVRQLFSRRKPDEGWQLGELRHALWYAYLAADHLQGAAGRISGTFLARNKKPQLVRLA